LSRNWDIRRMQLQLVVWEGRAGQREGRANIGGGGGRSAVQGAAGGDEDVGSKAAVWGG
jgi:hypothetical protein